MFSIAIQLSLFFVGASAALWVDQIYHGNIGRLTNHAKMFTALMIVLLIVCPFADNHSSTFSLFRRYLHI